MGWSQIVIWSKAADHRTFHPHCPLPTEDRNLRQSDQSEGRTAGSVSQICGWPAARPPINIMQVHCCGLPCVSPRLRSITWTYWTPPQNPPTPPLLAEGLVCAFSTSLSYIPSLKRAVSARLLENYRNSIDGMSSIVHNKIDSGWAIMKQWRLWAFVLNYVYIFVY